MQIQLREGVSLRCVEAVQTLELYRRRVVVIGSHWMKTPVDSNVPSGAPIDYVKVEITKLLNSGKAIAPILVEGASLPENSELPAELAPPLDFKLPY